MLTEGTSGIKVLLAFSAAVRAAVRLFSYAIFRVVFAASGFPNFLEY